MNIFLLYVRQREVDRGDRHVVVPDVALHTAASAPHIGPSPLTPTTGRDLRYNCPTGRTHSDTLRHTQTTQTHYDTL